MACVGLIEWKLFAFGEYHLDSKQIHLVQYGFFCYSLNDATPKDSELISCDVISTTETIAVKSMWTQGGNISVIFTSLPVTFYSFRLSFSLSLQ